MLLQLFAFLLMLLCIVTFGSAIIAYGLGFMSGAEFIGAAVSVLVGGIKAATHVA